MQFRNPQPIFIQIADYMVSMIINGHWLSGEKIPSVRELASDIEVNPNTVSRTYQYLNEKEIIFTKRGRGYFVHDDAQNRCKSLLRHKFFKEELPPFIKMMSLLDLSLEDLKKYDNE